MIKISIQYFGGRGGGGSGGARGGGRAGGGKASLEAEQTLSAKDLALKNGMMSPALVQAMHQGKSLNKVGDYVQMTKTLKDGSVEVTRMEVTGTAKYNDVFPRSPMSSNPDIPRITVTQSNGSTRTTYKDASWDIMNSATTNRSKTKTLTVKTYKKR